MRECPKCNYVDPPYWRNRLFDYEVDICKLEDLEHIDIDLMIQLLLAKRGSTITKDKYCYRLTKTGWVYRIWESLFKVRGWSPQKYYDGSGSRASTLRKLNLKAYHSDKMNEDLTSQKTKILDEIKQLRSDLENVSHNFT